MLQKGVQCGSFTHPYSGTSKYYIYIKFGTPYYESLSLWSCTVIFALYFALKGM